MVVASARISEAARFSTHLLSPLSSEFIQYKHIFNHLLIAKLAAMRYQGHS